MKKLTLTQEFAIPGTEITLEAGDQILVKEADTDTAKCPDCGSKYLKATGYCVKCKKKVKKEADTDTAKCPDCGSKYLKATGYCLKCKKKVAEPKKKKEDAIKEGMRDAHSNNKNNKINRINKRKLRRKSN